MTDNPGEIRYPDAPWRNPPAPSDHLPPRPPPAVRPPLMTRHELEIIFYWYDRAYEELAKKVAMLTDQVSALEEEEKEREKELATLKDQVAALEKNANEREMDGSY